MTSIRNFAAAAVMCLISASAMAQNSGMEILRQMEAKFANLKSVAGTISQTRKDPPPFQTEKTASAQFQILKPSNFRATFQDGEVQLISGKTFYHYVPQQQQVITYNFKGNNNVRDLNYMLLGFGANADEVAKVYKVSGLEQGYGVMLTPRSTKDANYSYIAMEVDRNSLYPTRFTMRQLDKVDLVVTLNPGGLQVNPSLSEANFQPNFPKNAHKVNMD